MDKEGSNLSLFFVFLRNPKRRDPFAGFFNHNVLCSTRTLLVPLLLGIICFTETPPYKICSKASLKELQSILFFSSSCSGTGSADMSRVSFDFRFRCSKSHESLIFSSSIFGGLGSLEISPQYSALVVFANK